MQSLTKLSLLIVVFTTTIYGDNPIEIILTNENTNWLSILLPISTMLIVIAGFFITRQSLKQNNEQIKYAKKIEVLAKGRQDWINTLRDEISFFLGAIKASYSLLNEINYQEKQKENIGYQNTLELKWIFQIEKNQISKSKIELLLNSDDPNHKKLINILIEIVEILNSVVNDNLDIDNSDKKLYDCREALIKTSQITLKKEWEKIKEFDL